jgi:MoxR-like ATPase
MFDNLIKEVSKVIVGNENKIKLTIAAILSEGSVLIEDNPGSGKTTFAKAITLNLGLGFKRIQFTSDLLPSDILGFNIFKNEELNFQKGPIFTNIVLADELNRGSPKSQSAFLEAMEEKNVSIDGATYKLPEPFFVIATQNPMDSSGTSTLPDSQLDRFMISFSLSELSDKDKVLMLKNNIDLTKINSEKINWSEIQDKKSKINVSDEIYQYTLEIEQTINSLDQQIYISPRCLKQIIDLGKGWAVVNSKDYVTHQDIKDLLPYILRHRIKFLKQEEKENFVNNEILGKISIKR